MIQKMEAIAKHIDSDLIEKKHYFIKEGKCYPLANTSLLLDLYDSWYRKLRSEQKRQFINQALTGIALSLSKLERDNAITFLCPVARTEDRDVSVQLEHYPFVIISRKGIILPINSWEYDSKGIDTLYEKINTLAENNSLFLAELVCRTEDKQLRGVTIERGTQIKFLVIDDWANPEENYSCLGNHEERYLHCNALDVVYYLLFMKDADELYDYIGFSYENYIDISNNLACIDLLLSILFKHKYIKRNSTVLDFGCGSGLSLRSNWRNICNIIGYESNHTMYSIARSRGLKVYLPEMIDTCLDNSINAVFASFVFHMYIDYDVLKCISLKLKDKTAWSLNFYKDINKDKTIQMFQNLGYHHECVGKMKKIGSVYIFYR